MGSGEWALYREPSRASVGVHLYHGCWVHGKPLRSKKVIVQKFPGATQSGSLSVAETGSGWAARAELLEDKGKGAQRPGLELSSHNPGQERQASTPALVQPMVTGRLRGGGPDAAWV